MPLTAEILINMLKIPQIAVRIKSAEVKMMKTPK
jgi:hypothetical protein